MNGFIETYVNSEFPLNAVGDRSWLEIALILTPTVLLIIGLFFIGLFLKRKFLKKIIFFLCIALSLLYLPYELFRQATEISKADTNINITQASLKELLEASDLNHIEQIVDKGLASKALEKLLFDMTNEQKQTLVMVSWLIAENEVKARQHLADRYQLLNEDIASNLSNLKEEIIDSQIPAEKISAAILQGIDQDVAHMVEVKMSAFNEEIDRSLESFQKNINTFIQNQLLEYNVTLDSISKKNIDELRQHADQARNDFAKQVNESNQKSIKKIEDTKRSVDNVGATLASANLENVVTNVNQLSASIESIQKRNEILFTYNECLRTVGLIDLAGKELECRRALHEAMETIQAD